VSFSIATFFTVRGAWHILGFAVLEMSAVGIAFLHFARHATDSEHLELTDRLLVVTLIQRGKERCFYLELHSVRLELPRSRDGLICLEDGTAKVEIGRFLSHSKRREFAAELGCYLSAGK
jgi:uncharacterized membrane protein